MADTNLKPGTTIAKTQSNFLAGNTEKHEVVRKNNNRSLPEKAEPKVLRDMTVSYVSIRHYDRKTNRTKRYTRSASLRLNGTWMEEAGFTTGTKIDVRVMPGCLVITIRPVETPLMKELNNISQLPEEEQQQAILFLQGVAAKVALETA
ncbi:SymE family type I addiction module toxin [Klebsiella electrica]|uniref:SymE family type I addiction module toxin n=1 Tax=Klebsiella electrica TaxID=1259973 RepID=A0AAJ5QSB1_9ENTR|nr:SymE family type I addiction module toxin [Klebsiella electrica]WBW60497.1 SymE family type I addiction module toxin [Klebsiella electrica]